MMNDDTVKEFQDNVERNKARQKKLLDLNTLSLHYNGQPFDESPIEWQRMVEDMYDSGIRFEVIV